MLVPHEVFTADEVARATGVPASAVAAVVASGDLRPLPGTRFFAAHDVLRTAWRLRAAAVMNTPPSIRGFFASSGPAGGPAASSPRPFLASCAAHVVLFVASLVLSSGSPQTVAAAVAEPPDGLVYLVMRGPGGGGGGSGARDRRPAARITRSGSDAVSVPLLQPDPVVSHGTSDAPAPSPTPSPMSEPEEPPAPAPVTAPLAATAAASEDQKGVSDAVKASSEGPGTGNNAGDGRGTGVGDGLGAGIGAGAGGGIGGGPYRPGSGIQPPKLLREVKADYSEEARRRGISGDVILEIVVRQDGRVGDITILRGLGAGLDQLATAAVRQWLFSPALRQGTPVDVLVEVAVEFSLR